MAFSIPWQQRWRYCCYEKSSDLLELIHSYKIDVTSIISLTYCGKMAMKMELGSLLDIAIGKPEAGAVNFKVLHSFLQKLLGHFAVTNVEVEVLF